MSLRRCVPLLVSTLLPLPLVGAARPALGQSDPAPALGRLAQRQEAAPAPPASSPAASSPAASPAAGLSLDLAELRQVTGQPPLPDSTALREDLAVLRWLQLNRTPQMVTTTWSTLARDLAVFSPAVGVDMVKTTPVLLRGLGPFMALVDQGSDAIKKIVRRPRPFASHADLKPCLPLETGFSFPSGHSSWYAAAALLLSDLLPERQERILALGSYGGANRVMCGVHYPSDVVAAQRFARAATAQIITSPQWRRFRAEPALQAELSSVRSIPPEALPLLLR